MNLNQLACIPKFDLDYRNFIPGNACINSLLRAMTVPTEREAHRWTYAFRGISQLFFEGPHACHQGSPKRTTLCFEMGERAKEFKQGR